MNDGRVSARVTPRSPSQLYVLVVEDEVLIRMMLSESLREAGYEVGEAVDADEALCTIGKFKPDLIITDVRMPGSMDGLAMLKTVRTQYPTLPAIVTSGHLSACDAPSDNCTYFLQKPVPYEVLVECLQKAIGITSTVEAPDSD